MTDYKPLPERYQPKTVNGYDFFEVSSALQKSIRRGLEDDALFWMVELFLSNYGEYCWKRLKIIVSEDIGLAAPNLPANIQALYQMYSDQVKKSDGKKFPERLFLTHAVIMMCRAKKSRLVDWSVMAYWDTHADTLRDIPDVALDKHSARGRKKGRGWKHFFEEGTLLEPHEIQPGETEVREIARKSRLSLKKADEEVEQDTLL